MKAKAKALNKMKKVRSSTESCSKCGEKISHSVSYESGHREHHHESGERGSEPVRSY